ncbi:MAG: hypothetical protein Q8S21_02355 [Candidatus Paracaedibacteraceae bacterium]|nr:hypothetical protein [Candidatus Paracaedibacteraceae bacterium]
MNFLASNFFYITVLYFCINQNSLSANDHGVDDPFVRPTLSNTSVFNNSEAVEKTKNYDGTDFFENDLQNKSSKNLLSVFSTAHELGEQKSDVDSVLDLEQGVELTKTNGNEISTQTSLKLSELIMPETRLQHLKQAFFKSSLLVMSKVCGITLNLLGIGELLFPLAALYYLGLDSSPSSECEQTRSHKNGLLLLTAGVACTTLKRACTLFVILRKQLIELYEDKKKSERKDSNTSTDDGRINEVLKAVDNNL